MYFSLKDSQYFNYDESKWHKGHSVNDVKEASSICYAIDKLKEDIVNNKINFYSFSNKKYNNMDEDGLIWYEIKDIKSWHSENIIKSVALYTSHYIGFYSCKVKNEIVNISISPRYGYNILNYLFSYAFGIYIKEEDYKKVSSEETNSLWLLALMWKVTLLKAIEKSHIPKEYQKFSKNLSRFKGRLNVAKQIKYNIVNQSRFYCDFKKLTADTAINRTVRHVYKTLGKMKYKSILKDLSSYDSMLEYMGVRDVVSPEEIRKIKYTKLNKHYKKVMELSELLMKQKANISGQGLSKSENFSYFIDIAELWENYLLKLLQKNLVGYDVYSPNIEKEQYLFDGNTRQIRPDIIIEKNGKVVAILDAKYKSYTSLGKNGTYPNVSRDDLYQMCTYMYHYADKDDEVFGIFVSPIKQEEVNLLELSQNKKHKIGVVNLNIDIGADKFIGKIKDEEKSFIGKIEKMLKSIKQ